MRIIDKSVFFEFSGVKELDEGIPARQKSRVVKHVNCLAIK